MSRLAAVVALGAAVVLGACGQNGSGGTKTFTAIANHGITPSAPINIYNDNGNAFDTYNSMQLAYSANDPTDPTKLIPALAKDWTLSADGTKLTVDLQPSARWSDGSPVTANDVKASYALAFAQGTVQAYSLGTVTVLGDKKVELDMVPGSTYAFFPRALQTAIIPASYWATQLPPDIWQTIATSQYAGADPTQTAAAKAATQTLTVTLGKQLQTVGPAKDISAGPFVLSSLNSGEAVFKKNPDFYAADRITADQVKLLNYTGNEQIWNYMIAGRLDNAPNSAMPQNVLNRILSTKGNQKVSSVSYTGASLAFDQATYPYGIAAVRQAIARIIDRAAVTKVGEPVTGTLGTWTTGMVDIQAKAYLTSAQLGQLQKYSHDLTAATDLLQGAGFKKSGSQWLLPNGQPWTITLWAVQGFSDWIQAASLIANELSDFGIPTTTQTATDFATFQADQKTGKYAVQFYLDGVGPAISTVYGRIYGAADGYTTAGGKLVHDTTRNDWVNAPETVTLADGTTVNPGQLTYQLGQTRDLAAQRPIVWQLAQAVNQTLPVIEIWDYINVQIVNTSRFDNFPPNGNVLYRQGPGLWMALGYVRAR